MLAALKENRALLPVLSALITSLVGVIAIIVTARTQLLVAARQFQQQQREMSADVIGAPACMRVMDTNKKQEAVSKKYEAEQKAKTAH